MKKIIVALLASFALAGCAVPSGYINTSSGPQTSYRYGYWIRYGWDNEYYPYYYPYYPDDDRPCCYERNWDNDGWHRGDDDRPHR